MSLEQKIYSVLLVSASTKVTDSLTALLPSSDFFPVHAVKSISAASRSVDTRTYDFIIISSPLTDDTGIAFAIDTAASKTSVVLVLVPNDIHDEIYTEVGGNGVFTLAKPFSKQSFQTALQWMRVIRESLRRHELKTLSFEEKMEEIRLVNRAKWILIRELQMDEPQAHRYIEKQAMDRCVPKREIAETVINTYSCH